MSVKRNPDQTREAILSAAFEEIHEQGFRAASLDSILRRTGVTKGALYHHFPNKTALGYAVVDEVIYPWAAGMWARLLDERNDPLDTLLEVGMEQFHIEEHQDLSLGCPVNNLVQEMAGIDEGFRDRLNRILNSWRSTIESALARGQREGTVRQDINPSVTAAFLLAVHEGCVSLAKCSKSREMSGASIQGVEHYLDSLRTGNKRSKSAA